MRTIWEAIRSINFAKNECISMMIWYTLTQHFGQTIKMRHTSSLIMIATYLSIQASKANWYHLSSLNLTERILWALKFWLNLCRMSSENLVIPKIRIRFFLQTSTMSHFILTMKSKLMIWPQKRCLNKWKLLSFQGI